MLRRIALLVVCLALASAVLAQRPPAAVVAQSASVSGLDVVRAAYDDLLDRFFRLPKPVDLLQAGWQAPQKAQPTTAALDPLPDDRGAAFAAFAQRFSTNSGTAGSDAEVQAAYTVVGGMAQSLHDQHTAFLRPELFRSVLASLGGDKPVGPGIHLAPRFPLIVSGVAPGGPAESAGVLSGDQIDAVDGKPIARLTTDEIVRGLVASPQGTTVTYSITRDGAQLQIAVTSAPFYFPVLDSRLLADGTGYLHLDQFADAYAPLPDGTVLLDDLDRRLDALDAQGATGLVLDLRGNSGGSETTVQELLGRFLPADSPIVIQRDERGHEITTVVAGRMRAKQLPLVVLVNRGSASASEMTASTLREANRAIIVGDRTAGALTSSNILPLPGGAGLQVAAADVLTARQQFRIDGKGFPVDITALDTRTQADFRSGRDPQLDAAVRAVARAPAPPAPSSPAGGLTAAALAGLLARYAPAASAIPTNERLTQVVDGGAFEQNQPGEAIEDGARDPAALQRRITDRGWLGRYVHRYTAPGRQAPYVAISINLYRSTAGARDALEANDFPDTQQVIPPPVSLGDDTVAFRGAWFAEGSTAIIWRHGPVVFAVAYSDAIGPERIDALVALARLVDAAYDRDPTQAGRIDSGEESSPAFPAYRPHIVRNADAGLAAAMLAAVAVAAGALAMLIAVSI